MFGGVQSLVYEIRLWIQREKLIMIYYIYMLLVITQWVYCTLIHLYRDWLLSGSEVQTSYTPHPLVSPLGIYYIVNCYSQSYLAFCAHIDNFLFVSGGFFFFRPKSSFEEILVMFVFRAGVYVKLINVRTRIIWKCKNGQTHVYVWKLIASH